MERWHLKQPQVYTGFNTDISDDAEARAKSLGVEVKTFDVIYALLDDVRGRMEGRLKAVTEKVPCGKAEVKALFGKGGLPMPCQWLSH